MYHPKFAWHFTEIKDALFALKILKPMSDRESKISRKKTWWWRLRKGSNAGDPKAFSDCNSMWVLGLTKAYGSGALFAFNSHPTTFQTHGSHVDLFPYSFDPKKENNAILYLFFPTGYNFYFFLNSICLRKREVRLQEFSSSELHKWKCLREAQRKARALQHWAENRSKSFLVLQLEFHPYWLIPSLHFCQCN